MDGLIDRYVATTLLDDLHAAQNTFYGGGDEAPLRAKLCENIRWNVPGNNAIAGSYSGIDAVFGYFRRRRDLARATMRMHRRDILTGTGSEIAALTDGTAVLSGHEQRWSTVGLYRIDSGRIAACWLLPLDAELFDRLWAG